jgi:TRAP-type C4-dicarboxylate transport system permease small subunit
MVATSLPDKARRILVGATDIVVLIIAIVMCVIGFQVTKSSYVSNIAVADFLNTPKWILLIPIPVSSFFLAIQAIRNAIAAFTSKTGMLGGAH